MRVRNPFFVRRRDGRRTIAAYVGTRLPSTAGRCRALAAMLLVLVAASQLGTAAEVLADPASVRIVDASRTTRCAEEDNLYVPLFGNGIGRFRIVATHPVYIGHLKTDSTAPDFTDCDMRGDPAFDFAPRTVTLLETSEIALIGHAFPRFWRPERVPVRIGDRTEDGLHLLQLFLQTKGGPVEFLVLYPTDGYWRLRPLPTASLPDGAYGSSFLIGPVEERIRPMVGLRSVIFDPAARTFRLDFRSGGRGTLRVASIDDRRAVLDVRLEPAVPAGRPFAALRSMFVSPQVADAAEVLWQAEPGGAWRSQRIGTPLDQPASAVRFARSEVSRHNSSAPDLLFEAFGTASGGR